LDLAHKLFDEINERDALSWTILFSGCSRIGKHKMGLSSFAQMMTQRDLPNGFFSSVA